MIQAYLFEARSIQSYVFAGGKLRDMVAASNLVDQLTGPILDATLESLNIKQDIQFSRRAGGAFYAISSSQDCITKLASIWPLIVSGLAPSLEFITHTSQAEQAYHAVKQGLDALKDKRNNPNSPYPIVPPIAQRAQRTGAGAIYSLNDGLALSGEAIDFSTAQKRKFANQGFRETGSVTDALALKFSPLGVTPYWPKALTAEEGIKSKDVLPLGDNSYMAVIHIDGNGLGQLLIQLGESAESVGEQYSELYLSFSEAITQATLTAAQQAVAETLDPHDGETIAARPLVLGGDDLTIIVAADRAINFASAFILAFEKSSSASLRTLRNQFNHLTKLASKLPEKLTACGGIAFVKASYPFSSAAHLAEELCQRAKIISENAKPIGADTKASSLCWHKVSTSIVASANNIFSNELAYEYEGQKHYLSLGAYSVQSNQIGLPSLVNLKSIASRWVEKSHKSKFRQYLSYLKTNPSLANSYMQRLMETHDNELQCLIADLNEMWAEQQVINSLQFLQGSNTMSPLADILVIAKFIEEHKENADVV